MWRFHPPLPAGGNLHKEPAHNDLPLIPAIAALRMNPRMARLAQRHEVSLVMRPALCQRQPVVYLLHRPQQPLLPAFLTERVLCGVTVTDSFPRPAVPTAYSRVAVVLLVAAVLLFPCSSQNRPSVSFGQPGKEHGLFGFLGIHFTSSRHKESPRRILLLPRRPS